MHAWIARVRRHPDWAAFGWVLLAQLSAIALTPALTGHDLPQHLAYARLLADVHAHALPATYEPPLGDDPYFMTYRWLAWLSRAMPLTRAVTLVYGAYAIALSFAFAWLARVANGAHRGSVCMTIVLGPLVVWNPITCMGFLPFMLGLPVAIAGCAATLSFSSETRSRPFLAIVAACGALLASIHVVLLAMWLFALACLFLARPSSRRLAPLVVAIVASGVVIAWFSRHRVPTPSFDWRVYFANVETYGVIAGTKGTFVLSWSSPVEHAKLIAATVLGPFPWAVKILLATAVLGFASELRRALRTTKLEAVPARRTLAIAGAIFFLATLCVPTAIQRPDDICLIDLRMYAFDWMLVLAAFPSRLLERRAARRALQTLAVLFVGAWSWSLNGAGKEAKSAIDLARLLDRNDRVLALSFHDRSAYLDEDNAILHYLPVHHTAIAGGSTSTFWGKFSPHLPIGWAEGAEPPHPPCWAPETFRDEDLAAATHVLASLPHEDDPLEKKWGAARLLARVGTSLELLACKGDFCLYRVH